MVVSIPPVGTGAERPCDPDLPSHLPVFRQCGRSVHGELGRSIGDRDGRRPGRRGGPKSEYRRRHTEVGPEEGLQTPIRGRGVKPKTRDSHGPYNGLVRTRSRYSRRVVSRNLFTSCLHFLFVVVVGSLLTDVAGVLRSGHLRNMSFSSLGRTRGYSERIMFIV